ncbi:MAG: hypothetical protein ACYST0_03990 [Planctomycetota bacterium]|jgi:hypothetical protein
MRALPFLAALVAAAATTALAAQDPARDTAEATAKPKKLTVRVLYAGDQDHPRTEQWRGFLGRYFTKVGTVQLSELSTNATEGFDVVIVDSPTPYRLAGKFKMPPTPTLSDAYDRPTILMGAAGGSVIRRARIKIGWL